MPGSLYLVDFTPLINWDIVAEHVSDDPFHGIQTRRLFYQEVGCENSTLPEGSAADAFVAEANGLVRHAKNNFMASYDASYANRVNMFVV